MMNWDGDWSWGAWLGMAMMMVVFWGGLAWVIVAVVRSQKGPGDQTAQQILDARLARGEITIEEFEALSAAMRQGPSR